LIRISAITLSILGIITPYLQLIDFRHKSLIGDGRTDVALLRLARRQGYWFWSQVLEWNFAEQLNNAVESGAHHVIGIYHRPERLFDICLSKHLKFGNFPMMAEQLLFFLFIRICCLGGLNEAAGGGAIAG
jgi:hypothetical protein